MSDQKVDVLAVMETASRVLAVGNSTHTAANLDEARIVVAQLIKVLGTAQWMLERDYIDDQKMAVIVKCRDVLDRIGPTT